MKLFYATLSTETNTFSPIPTGLNSWRSGTLMRSNESEGPTARRVRQTLRPLLDWAAARGWKIEVGLVANAEPAGIMPRSVYEELRDELIKDLRTSLPVDGVVLYPHGAMVAEGYDDCAGDLLTRSRAVVGSEVPIGAALDPHCHLTDDMLRNATVLVGFKEYPHIDAIDRILEAFELVAHTAEGKIRPAMARFECRMIESFPTTSEPMKSVVREMKELEGQSGVLNVWLCHGFPYSDVPTIGAQAVAITDGNPALAAQIAEQLGRRFFSLRKSLRRTPLSIDQSLTRAMGAERGPVTIADSADNPGGGAPGDSTFFLREMIKRGIEDAAVGPIYDPGAVSICHDAGVGGNLQLRIGGKLGPSSGNPIDVTCTVIGLANEVIQNYAGLRLSLGACAAVKVHLRSGNQGMASTGIDVVLAEKREQARTPELFTSLNIDAAAKKILVVKSTNHFHAGFAPISSEVLYSAGAGALQGDVTAIPYTRVATHRYWPFVDDPFAEDSDLRPF
jgi:microcystin degradation protein MlrC